jgi:hypothetical protein
MRGTDPPILQFRELCCITTDIDTRNELPSTMPPDQHAVCIFSQLRELLRVQTAQQVTS